MFKSVAENVRMAASAVAAITIVSAAGLTLDQAHLAAAPRGTVEIGELAPADTTMLASLPEVVVNGKRETPQAFAAVQLPEVVVVAKRMAGMVAHADRKPRPAPGIHAGF
jgi:hypothetical protein